MSENTKALTLSALSAALGTVLLALTGLLPTLRLALLCVAGLLTLPVRQRWGIRWGVCVWAVTALLALLVAPVRDTALGYTLFAGWYPLLKLRLERMNRNVRRACKAGIFLAVSAVLTFVADTLLGDVLPRSGLFLLTAFFVLCWVYDFASEQAILVYIRKIAGRINHG